MILRIYKMAPEPHPPRTQSSRSLVGRLNDIHKLKDDLQEQLSHVEEEIAKAQKVSWYYYYFFTRSLLGKGQMATRYLR